MGTTMVESLAETPQDFDLRDMAEGVDLLAATANVIMQLAWPEVGYGVVESKVGRSQVMRHPLPRWRTTLTYLSVALIGRAEEREAYRRMVNRSHAQVRPTPQSPVSYSAFDAQLQRWVAACLYQGMTEMYDLLHGPADDQTADAIYRAASRFGTTLQMPAQMWPSDRAAFGRYWDAALTRIRIDPPVRAYLYQLIMLEYLPQPLSAALSPLNRFFTTGFLPQPFREQMRLPWTERDQHQFESVMRIIATINGLLPAPVRRFPFNACLLGHRVSQGGTAGQGSCGRTASRCPRRPGISGTTAAC